MGSKNPASGHAAEKCLRNRSIRRIDGRNETLPDSADWKEFKRPEGRVA